MSKSEVYLLRFNFVLLGIIVVRQTVWFTLGV